jgi:hypothetical protein
MSNIRNNGSFIGTSKGDTSTTEKTRGIWYVDDINARINDYNWAHYDKDLTVNTTYRWTPKGSRVDTVSNVSDPYEINRFRHTATSTNCAIYIGFELKGTNSAFYKDMTIGGLEVNYTNTSGTPVTETTTGTSFSALYTTTAGVSSSTSPTGLTYSQIATGTTAERWNIDSAGTGSSHTGMSAGIDNTADFDSQAVSQVSSSYYLYCETSSPMANGDTIWFRKLIVPQPGTEVEIKIASFFNTSSTGTWSSVVQDCMLIRIAN